MAGKSIVLGRNILINFISQGLVLAVTFFTTPYILKTLGQTNYSLIIFITSVVMFLSAFDFGLTPAFVQAYAQAVHDPVKRAKLLTAGWLLYLSLSIIYLAGLNLAAPLILNRFFPITAQVGRIAADGLMIMSFTLFFSMSSYFLSLVFQATQEFHWFNLRQIISGSVIPVGTVILLRAGRGLTAIFTLHLYTYALLVLGYIFLVNIKGYGMSQTHMLYLRREITQLWKFARWKTVGQLAGQIKQKGGRFILGAILPLGNLANFVIPQNLADRYLSVQPNITTPLFTMAASISREKKDFLEKLYRHAVKLVNYLLLPAGIAMIFTSRLFLRLWIGPEFAAISAPVMQVLFAGMLLGLLNGVPTVFLEGIGNAKMPAIFSLLIAGLYILLSVVLIPVAGPLGAALAILMTYAVQVPVYLYQSARRLLAKTGWRYWWTNYGFPTIVPILIGLGLAYRWPQEDSWLNLIAYLALFLGIFYLAVIVLGLIRPDEKKIALALWKKISRQ